MVKLRGDGHGSLVSLDTLRGGALSIKPEGTSTRIFSGEYLITHGLWTNTIKTSMWTMIKPLIEGQTFTSCGN